MRQFGGRAGGVPRGPVRRGDAPGPDYRRRLRRRARDGRGVHQRHAGLRRPAGRYPMTAAVPGLAAPDALAAALAPDLVAVIGYLTAPEPEPALPAVADVAGP